MTGRKIAVIGGGVSGLTAAYILARTDEVTIFEADDRLGGHADTHLVPQPGAPQVAVDTGFIVYNERTYPLLTRLFGELGVTTQPAEMSMSVSCSGCGACSTRASAAWPASAAACAVAAPLTCGCWRRSRGSTGPRGGCWHPGSPVSSHSASSCAPAASPRTSPPTSRPRSSRRSGRARRARRCATRPATCSRFLANHGMLSVSGSPQWRTVTGGSRCYVERIAEGLAKICLSSPVAPSAATPTGCEVRDASGEAREFDAAVIATHPDQALRLLAAPRARNESVLGAFRYTPNQAVLHTDTRLLPARASVRASWNYSLRCPDGADAADAAPPRISYYLNRLQGLPAARDYIVTLGESADIDPARRIAVMAVRPSRLHAGVGSRAARLPDLNSAVTAFAGAYHGWGFHEDGCRSGVAAARALGGVW